MMSVLFPNNTWDQWIDKTKSHFSCYTFFSHRNMQ